MKTRLLSQALLATALAAAGCTSSPSDYTIERQAVHGLPTVTATDTTTAKVTVEAIDYDSRSIALTGSDGKTEFFQCAAPFVRNFNQIKKGDTVQVHYDTRLHISIRQVNETPNAQLTEVMQTAEPGQKPGCVLYRHVESQATVLSIDYTTRVVSMRMPPGDILTLTASEKLPDFDKVKVGDTVIFDYTESLTVDVF